MVCWPVDFLGTRQMGPRSDFVWLQALFGALQDLLLQKVIVPVPVSEQFQGLYSNLFTFPKKEGKVGPILDLKALNCFVRVQKFRIKSIRTVVAFLH